MKDGEDAESVLPSAASSRPDEQQPELWLSGSKASSQGWVRVCDGTERVFYHCIDSGKITLERPADFGDDNPIWADGKSDEVLYMDEGCHHLLTRCVSCQARSQRMVGGVVHSRSDPPGLACDR